MVLLPRGKVCLWRGEPRTAALQRALILTCALRLAESAAFITPQIDAVTQELPSCPDKLRMDPGYGSQWYSSSLAGLIRREHLLVRGEHLSV